MAKAFARMERNTDEAVALASLGQIEKKWVLDQHRREELL